MEIEGRTPNIGAIGNVLNRDGIIGLFTHKLNQCLLQRFTGALRPSVSSGHGKYALSGQKKYVHLLNKSLRLFKK